VSHVATVERRESARGHVRRVVLQKLKILMGNLEELQGRPLRCESKTDTSYERDLRCLPSVPILPLSPNHSSDLSSNHRPGNAPSQANPDMRTMTVPRGATAVRGKKKHRRIGKSGRHGAAGEGLHERLDDEDSAEEDTEGPPEGYEDLAKGGKLSAVNKAAKNKLSVSFTCRLVVGTQVIIQMIGAPTGKLQADL
jgi:hypothetical protein